MLPVTLTLPALMWIAVMLAAGNVWEALSTDVVMVPVLAAGVLPAPMARLTETPEPVRVSMPLEPTTALSRMRLAHDGFNS